MQYNPIENLSRSLPVARRRRRSITRELRSHIEETQRELELAGWHPEAAARESMARLGDPDEIAEAFGEVYRPARRRRIGLAFGLAGALLAGAYGASGTLASTTVSHHQPTPHTQTTQRAHHYTHGV